MSIPCVVCCLLVMSMPAAADAQNADTPAAESDRWVVQITPYV
jgi:hypothetical protein